MNLTPDDREVGRENYYSVLSDYDQQTFHRHRRGFPKAGDCGRWCDCRWCWGTLF